MPTPPPPPTCSTSLPDRPASSSLPPRPSPRAPAPSTPMVPAAYHYPDLRRQPRLLVLSSRPRASIRPFLFPSQDATTRSYFMEQPPSAASSCALIVPSVRLADEHQCTTSSLYLLTRLADRQPAPSAVPFSRCCRALDRSLPRRSAWLHLINASSCRCGGAPKPGRTDSAPHLVHHARTW